MELPRPTDPDWLATAVSHLGAGEKRLFLERLRSGGEHDATLAPEAHAPPPTGHGEDVPGAMIGNFRLLDRIGEGGFGSVFIAEQLQPVRRRVALKILKRGMDTQRVVARFEVERQALAMMDHPHIAKVLDAGETPSGRPYFAMELVKGEPITDFCDRERMPVAQRVALLRAVCAAVQHAHQKGIIHRDLKPSNVLVSTQDGVAVPKVIDFGIAKALHGHITDETIYTQVHQMLGTPMYMSPEQTGGSTLDIDTRTDIYSLGVLMYELLAGATPFAPETIQSLGPADLQRLIAHEDPPRPSARFQALGAERARVAGLRSTDAPRLARRLRTDLDWIILKCLEKDRARRYESASSLDDDLAHYLAGEPVRAGPPSAIYVARKFVGRHRAQVAAGTTIVLLLVLGLGGTMVALSRARSQSERLRFTLDFFTRALAGATDEATSLALWQEQPELTLGQALRSAEGLIDETFAHEPTLEAVIRELIGLAQLRGGEFNEAAQQLARAVEIRSEILGETDPSTLRLLLPLADAQSKVGDIEGAMAAARRAYDLRAAELGPEHAESRAAALWLARWLGAAYQFDEAERYFTLASREIQGVADTRDAITLAAMIDSCGVLVSKGRLERAEQMLQAAAPRIYELPHSLDNVRARFDRQLGVLLVFRGRPERAVEVLSAGGEGELGVPNGDRVRARFLAWALGKAGRAEESERLFRRLLAIERDAPGARFREIFARVYYADVLLDLGRPQEALGQIAPAVRQYDALGLPNDPDRLWAQAILGRALLDCGDAAGAAEPLADALAMNGLFPEHRLYVPGIRFAHARWLRATGDEPAAEAEAAAALEQAIEIHGRDHPLVAQITAFASE